MFCRARKIPTVTFATSCWEKDWKLLLEDPFYLKKLQIANNGFIFSEKILVINNVKNLDVVLDKAKKKVEEKILTRYVVAEALAQEILSFFQLKKETFKRGDDASSYKDVHEDWVYYNALSPLTAIYSAKSDYLLYLTGDVRLDKEVNWIQKAVLAMEKDPAIKVANLTWNGKYKEAKREAYKKSLYFYLAKEGFSDQMFLVKTADFRQPIYGEIRQDSSHYPRGDVFEKRVFSYMKNRGWERITYRWGSYTHENV